MNPDPDPKPERDAARDPRRARARAADFGPRRAAPASNDPSSDAVAQAASAPRAADQFVQSFARGLEVIRSFSADAPEQTLSQVAARAGLTRAAARRILLTLQTLGYVQSDERLFRLTPRILDLGFAYLSSMPMWNLAEPAMEALSAEVGESSSIAVLDGADVVYVQRVATHAIMRVSLVPGSRLPAYCTSMGRVLLAALPEAEAAALLGAAPLAAHARRTLTDPADLLAELARVRTQGWALVDQELEEGLISIAAPITGRGGAVLAALNVSGHAARTNARAMHKTILPPLLAAARQISDLLARR